MGRTARWLSQARSPACRSPLVTLPATGVGQLPQSVELSARSGVAEDWLVFAAVKWTDWSVLQNLTVTTPISTIVDQYEWRDGWTVTGGVVHSFNDTFAGQASLTWDRGVSTGWDLRNDIWTLAVGGRVRAKVGGEFRGGIGLSYLQSGEETQYANAIIPGNIHSGFNASTRQRLCRDPQRGLHRAMVSAAARPIARQKTRLRPGFFCRSARKSYLEFWLDRTLRSAIARPPHFGAAMPVVDTPAGAMRHAPFVTIRQHSLNNQ